MNSKNESQPANAVKLLKEEIIKNIDNAGKLELLYRENKTAFKRAFNHVYTELEENITIRIWKERLNYEQEDIYFGTNKEWVFVILAVFIAGLIAKIPDMTSIDQEFFYSRNLSFIVFPVLTVYFAWRQKISNLKLLLVSLIYLISALYINFLPNQLKSDTLILACMHLPVFLWSVAGFIYVGNKNNNYRRRIDFLRYNGDLAVMMAILIISGVILTMITFGLFELIDVKIESFFKQYVAIWGSAAIPIVATYLIQSNPQLVNKISPVIARLFMPVVLITLIVYLIAVIISGKDPYNNRDFLIIFNVMLIGVMAIILFSVAETFNKVQSKLRVSLLFALSLVAIIINGIALSAILFRITEWGISPNRLAVLGSNILMLTNLLIVTYKLYRTLRDTNESDSVEKSIASFIPFYIVWTVLVTFIFPVLFGFK
jgi:hypothetical protein